jgi:hypothetical protein
MLHVVDLQGGLCWALLLTTTARSYSARMSWRLSCGEPCNCFTRVLHTGTVPSLSMPCNIPCDVAHLALQDHHASFNTPACRCTSASSLSYMSHLLQ